MTDGQFDAAEYVPAESDDHVLVDAQSTAIGDGHDEVYDDEQARMPDDVRSADDVDPRKLVHDPSASELRWYYRNTPFAPTAVNKPVDDAHKHGYTIENDPTDSIAAFFEQYDPYRREARKKARRDGMAFVLWYLTDTAPSISREPQNVRSIEDFDVLTIDDLDDSMAPSSVEQFVDYDRRQITVLEQGVAIVDDVTTPDNGDILGVIYERGADETTAGGSRIFIHADRLQHFVANPEVDGPLYEDWAGHVTGHPVLGSVFHPLKALAKAHWALGQTLFRYTSPLHVIETPTGHGIDEEHLTSLNNELDGVNAKSGLTLPPDHTMETHGADGEMNPEPYLDGLVEAFCAGVEMTKSVLMGSQTGTVSGSSTDIKNYMNQVQRDRRRLYEPSMHEAARMAFEFDQRTVPSFALGFTVNWGPLFKLDRLEATEGMARLVQAASGAVSSFILTPNEAREILEQEWAELDADVDLDDLTEDDFDQLDRVNTSRGKQYAEGTSAEAEVDPDQGNRQVGQGGGGMEQGQTTDPDTPDSGAPS